MTGMQEQWQKISENLRGVLNPGIFKVWIHPLDAHIEGNSLCLAAPSEYVARWLRDRMADTFAPLPRPCCRWRRRTSISVSPVRALLPLLPRPLPLPPLLRLLSPRPWRSRA